MAEASHILSQARFPRSNIYDPDWVMSHQMGPNVIWLTEWLSEALELKPHMRVLDLGCGKAMSSIFLAKEFDLRVWATDLWVRPEDNWQRICECDMGDRVCPIHAEAHALPFAPEFFDLIVSVDAYQYFGTDELYLGYLSRFVRPGGKLCIVMPALMQDFGETLPQHLVEPQANGKRFWEDECSSFHTADWWQALWSRTNRLDEVTAETLTAGWRYWRDFELALEQSGKNIFPSDAEALDKDQGQYLGFVRLLGQRKKQALAMNLYDPALMALFDQGRDEGD